MNRRAAVLAADSAGTVEYWRDGEKQSRYFKGENKIFQLSNFAPIGLMTYGNADLQGVPWELLVKEFRDNLGEQKHDSIKAYASSLFDFLEANKAVYSDADRDENYKIKVMSMSHQVLRMTHGNERVSQAEGEENKREAFSALLTESELQIDALELTAPITAGELESALTDFQMQITAALQERARTNTVEELAEIAALLSECAEQISRMAIKITYKRFAAVEEENRTGIAIVGYGEADYFPQLINYRVYGFLRARLVHMKEAERSISATKKRSELVTLASTSMVETFLQGIAPDVYHDVGKSFEASLGWLTNELSGKISEEDMTALKKSWGEQATKKFTDSWFSGAYNRHYSPITEVIEMLPIDEMANLAETLINLESLKEKVTRPSESIGGPIDVASITKGEGFVWIKRKHYFEIDKNPRFAARMMSSHR